MNPIKFEINFEGKLFKSSSSQDILEVWNEKDFKEVDSFIQKNEGKHIFCLLSYDLKQILHKLPSRNPKLTNVPFALFVVFENEVGKNSNTEVLQKNKPFVPEIKTLNAYQQQFNKIKNHLQKGDLYETNYCIAPYFQAKIDPLRSYFNLMELNQAPYSAFVQYKDQYLMCSSPERFLKKEGTKLTSQPIKGTIKRGTTKKEDEALKKQLISDPKETAENIMIVDLVRNDLSQIAKRNSVKVENLNEIQSFQTVHQLVSTISCKLKDATTFSEILQATFPMGSMTGAPKRKAMELMEEYEDFARGVYSGSIGVIEPNGNFDLNVVIRSILYDDEAQIVSFPVGSAITYLSESDKEYEECRLKAKSMIRAIQYVK